MEKTMTERQADHLDEDFEVIELGSVSEETSGIPGLAPEVGTVNNSYPE